MIESEANALSFADAFEVLYSAFPDEDLVLVGGQAVGYFWLTHYRDSDAGLAKLVGVTSSDVDFLGTQEAAERFATAVRGHIKNEGARSPTMSVVTFHDRRGRTCIVDLRLVHGLSPERVRETAVPIALLDAEGASLGAELKVMHPLLCLESRVHNTHSLDRYRSARALKQLDAAIGCARAVADLTVPTAIAPCFSGLVPQLAAKAGESRH